MCLIPDVLSKLVEPIVETKVQFTILSNIVNLYYNTNVLTSASLNLNVRSQIEETTFLNFENKNGSF